jgi:hypothetical protein
MTTDWNGVAGGWVADGLITDGQRAPLVARLEQLQAEGERPHTLASGALVTALVLAGTWVIVGAIEALMHSVARVDPVADWAVLGLAGLLVFLAAAPLRVVAATRPVARGLFAAGVPLGTASLFGLAGEAGASALYPVLVVAPLIAWAIGAAEGSRAVVASSSVSAAVAVIAALAELRVRDVEVVGVIGAVAGLFVAALASRVVASRAEALVAGMPALVLLGVVEVYVVTPMFEQVWRALGASRWASLETGLFLLAFAMVSLVCGLIARSSAAVVPALLCVAVAVVDLAFRVGDVALAAVAMLVTGAGLFALALVVWVLPRLRIASAVSR